MNKIEKIDFIKKSIKEKELTAYKIAKAIGTSSVGIQKIINNETKNPNSSTLDLIIEYIRNPDKKSVDKVEDPAEKYITIPKTTELQQQIINMYKDIFELRTELGRLQRILEENFIEY